MSILLFTACLLKTQPAVSKPELANSDVLNTHATLAEQMWSEALVDARKLHASVEVFLKSPSAETMDKARGNWRQARVSYSMTEALRFQNGPIDHVSNGVEGQLNAWPLDEAFIDYTVDSQGGIINQPEKYPEISAEMLAGINEKFGEKSISLGYHAVEFLLWGQDLSADGPGQRSFKDYVDAVNSTRRAVYLRISSEQLVKDLNTVHQQWLPDAENHRKEFTAGSVSEKIQGILTGLEQLSGHEMSGERMAVALETGDQEDEQSCFSDNSLQDLINNLKGIDRIYNAGPQGVGELILKQNPELDSKIQSQLKTALGHLLAVPEPYDQSLKNTDSKLKFESAIENLEKLGALFTEAKKSLSAG